MSSPIVVLGAGGATGQECVKQLLEKPGVTVRAVVRSPDRYKEAFGGPKPNLDVVKGDVTDIDSLRTGLAGGSGVIFAASAAAYKDPPLVDFMGVKNVADVLKEQGSSQHVVLISSAFVTSRHAWNPIRMMLNNIKSKLMDNKFAGEEALRKSGCSYTVVRPGRLTSSPGAVLAGSAQFVVGGWGSGIGQGDTLTGAITRADVAALCISAVTHPDAKNKTLELVATAVPAGTMAPSVSDQLDVAFKSLKADN